MTNPTVYGSKKRDQGSLLREYSVAKMTLRKGSYRDLDPPQGAPGKRDHAGIGDQYQARARDQGRREIGREGMPLPRHQNRGHHYERVNIKDYARVHLGDTHIKQQHFHPKEDAAARKREQRKQFMQDLGFNMMGTRLATIGAAHMYTCRWLLNNENYLRWRNPRLRSSHHGFLWIKGKPGAGKSTLMKYALEQMQSHAKDDCTILSFFFNARGHDLEKTTEGMYRSILRQLFAQLPQRLPDPIPLYPPEWKDHGWPLEVLQDWLRKAILEHGVERKIICYVDALDECEEDAIRQAIDNFEALEHSSSTRGINFAICFASRHYPNITINYNETINLDIEEEHHKDITVFVGKTLRGERTLRYELGREISQRSSGVFLWAALVVQIVNKSADHGATRDQLFHELSIVPSGIGGLLKSIVGDQGSDLLLLLQWVLFSTRPLTTSDLYYTMKTSISCRTPDESTCYQSTDEQMRFSILTMSKGLVEFTKGETHETILDATRWQSSRTWAFASVQFIHETVREHLLNGGLTALDPGLVGNIEAASHAKLGRLCQNHIEATIFPRLSRHPFPTYSIGSMLAHFERALLGKEFDLSSIDAVPQSIWSAMRGYFDHDFDENHTPTSLYITVRARCPKLAVALLQRQSAADHGRNLAAETANLDKHDILSVDINATCGSRYHSTVLLAALEQSSIGLVESVLKCQADPNLAIEPDITPLSVALSSQRHQEDLKYHFVKLLLEHGADPNLPMLFSLSDLPLELALTQGSKRIIDLLLTFGARRREQANAEFAFYVESQRDHGA